MHDSRASQNVGQKSAQAGFTETLLNRVFYYIDVRAQSVLYVLPNSTPDAADFTATRFNPALEESTYLSRLFSNVNNVGVKRSGSASLYIRGSRSRAGLKSVPVGLVILDEVDEMTQENIPLAFERMSGQMTQESWLVSTPTIPGKGINAYYQNTTQEHFHFQCPFCSRWTELVYPECLVITAESLTDPRLHDTYIQCRECKHRLEHKQKAEWLKISKWIPTFRGPDSRGFHINQLYSSTVEPWQIAEKAILANTNAAHEQELYNSKLGLTHVVAGACVTDAQINDCKKSHRQPEGISPQNWHQFLDDPIMNQVANRNCVVTLGIDVGKYFHFTFEAWLHYPTSQRTNDPNMNAHPVVLKADKVTNIEELYPLIDFYQPDSIVIDAQPERRLSYQFCLRYPGRARMCFYIEGVTGRHFSEKSEDVKKPVTDEPTVSVDRTSWLDLSLGRFRGGLIHLPQNIQTEYAENIKALTRVPRRNRDGNIVYVYEHADGVADHFAHARNYSEIAYPFAAGYGTYSDIVEEY